jgi:hypothetical protein
MDSSEERRHTENLELIKSTEDLKFKKREERRLRNETKNIPKNFGKGIISFI